MADIQPFCALRPQKGLESRIAALPYDVYNREEAKLIVHDNPLSFLKIDRAETNFSDDISTYADCVYEKAEKILEEMTCQGQFIKEKAKCYYLYRLTMNGRSQTGIVACASIDDYETGIIKKHENTRAEKEADRIRHISVCNAQTGPIFLAFRHNEVLTQIIERTKQTLPEYDFTTEDGVGHTVWLIDQTEEIRTVQEAFNGMNQIYIADGHHRCASAVKVGLERRIPGQRQESDYFLSVLFPEEELKILDYNRVVKDLNNHTPEEILTELSVCFETAAEAEAVSPSQKGEFGMFLQNQWYRLKIREEYTCKDAVEGLDVSLLQKYVLDKIFDIHNPKTDHRIDFVGGIRGLTELERRVHTDAAIAFSMYPTSITELFCVADEGRLMPPKSTWFEPKLRSGLFIHQI